MTERITASNAETDKRSVARKVLRTAVERWHAGVASPDARRVLAENPVLSQIKSVVVDLAYEEYCCRIEAGEVIDRSDFCSKFPGFRTSICRRLEVHDFFVSEPAFPEPGQRLLGLQLIDELGRGALARVFLAEEIDVGNRLVAVKFSHEGQYEADFLGRLQHANIVPIHSVKFDAATGLSAVVMPYLGDKTLADTSISDLNDVLRIFIQLADALAYTHCQKILHRDLKPSNVLMGDRPMLMDFNLSADLTAESKRVGGTLQYMSPEQRAQVNGDPIEIDGRADIYSLGVMLSEALATWPVSRPIRRIIARCTATKPDDRFESAEALAAALRRELRLVPRGIRWSGKHSFLVTAILTACIAVTVSGGIAYATRKSPLERAHQLIVEGRPSEAVDILLNIRKKSAEEFAELGNARLAIGEFDAATSDFSEAFQMSNDARYAASAGYASSLNSQPVIALVWYERARDAGFDSPEMQSNEGFCLRRQGRLPDAKEKLEAALAAEPLLKTAILNLATVRLQLAVNSGTPVPEGMFNDALDNCPKSDNLYQNAALATILSDTPEQQRTDLTLARIESALNLGASSVAIRATFPMLEANERFQELLKKRRSGKRVPPIYLCDPLGSGAKYPGKFD